LLARADHRHEVTGRAERRAAALQAAIGATRPVTGRWEGALAQAGGGDWLVEAEADRLVIAPAGSPQRWAVGRPVDSYGDGYVHKVFVEISDDGIAASGWATFDGQAPQTLRDFLTGLGEEWRGWPGTRTWTSMEHEMTVNATHDGRGHVRIAVTLRRARRADHLHAWSARIVLTVEAGEQLRELADAADHLLRPPAR
jgi:Family of unknown function (DUF6228)